MILQMTEKEERCRVTLLENGMTTSYDVVFQVCANPVCTCNIVDMILTPVPEGVTEQQAPARVVPVDVERKKPADKGETRKYRDAHYFSSS